MTPSPGYGTTYNNDESMDPFEKFETSLGPNILPSTRLSFGKSYVEEFMNEDETGDVDNLEKPSRVQQLVEQFEEHQRQMSSRSEHYHSSQGSQQDEFEVLLSQSPKVHAIQQRIDGCEAMSKKVYTTCTLQQGTLATEIEKFKKVVKNRVEHRYKQVVVRVERLGNKATNSSQSYPPHESQRHSDRIRYLEQNSVDSESLKDILGLVEQRMEQVEANLDMMLKAAASASKVDETVTTIHERFSNFATRGDIQLMNVQLEEMQNIFASSLQMAKNTMHTIESTLASHSYAFDSFRSDYISHESVPGGSIMNFLHLIREHVDIGDNHVRDVLTNEVGLQLKQLQDRVEQVNERVDTLQVLCESKLRELHSSFESHFAQRLQAAFDTIITRVESLVQTRIGEHLKALNARIDESFRNNQSQFRSFNSHLDERIGKTLSQVEGTITKRSVEIEKRLNSTMNLRCDSFARQIGDGVRPTGLDEHTLTRIQQLHDTCSGLHELMGPLERRVSKVEEFAVSLKKSLLEVSSAIDSMSAQLSSTSGDMKRGLEALTMRITLLEERESPLSSQVEMVKSALGKMEHEHATTKSQLHNDISFTSQRIAEVSAQVASDPPSPSGPHSSSQIHSHPNGNAIRDELLQLHSVAESKMLVFFQRVEHFNSEVDTSLNTVRTRVSGLELKVNALGNMQGLSPQDVDSKLQALEARVGTTFDGVQTAFQEGFRLLRTDVDTIHQRIAGSNSIGRASLQAGQATSSTQAVSSSQAHSTNRMHDRDRGSQPSPQSALASTAAAPITAPPSSSGTNPRQSVGRGCDLEFPSSPTPAMSAHSPLLHWLYDPEGYLKPFRGLEPPSSFDATTLLPSGITPGFAFHEVRGWNDDIEFTSPPPGREFRGKGIFGSNTDGWIDPDLLGSLRRQFAIPIWDRKKMLYVDWELLYIDWYENTGRWFEMGYQLKLLVATQPEDRQVELITQIGQERLRIGEFFQLIRLYGRRHQNPYVPGNVFKALALPGSLQGQVGPEEWYNFFVRFLKHGRRTAAYGGTSMWEAHSVLIGAIIAYTSKSAQKSRGFRSRMICYKFRLPGATKNLHTLSCSCL